MGGGILPVALHKNKLYFLFGLENKKDDTPGWADFGGGKNNSESFFETAVREGTEELNGFLGNIKEVSRKVKRDKLLTVKVESYTTFIFYMDYDEKLPYYFNNNFRFSQRKMPDLIENTKNGLLEKQRIKWFSEDEIKKVRQFRSFYQRIVEKIIPEIGNIKKKLKMKHNKTVKNKK
tara:strand:+ start:1271 stop:1801 length:531 start_codon:yes stop_codon:yes gene_type:complete